MSDRISKALARFAGRIGYEDLATQTIEEVKRRFIDTMGCLAGGYSSEAATAARRLALRHASVRGATLVGSTTKTAVDYAALANGAAVRCLDYNDTYLSAEPLHPSDVIPPLLALAEERGMPGRKLVAAVAAAYEVGVLLCDAASLMDNGWDHVNYIAVATTVGGANLLELGEEQTKHALALAVVPHVAMRQTRNGELSMWKSVAAANAARNALFALQLAECGMSGPYAPFEGSMGMNALLLKGKLDGSRLADKLDSCRSPLGILRTHVKNWPVEYMAQSAVEAALKLRKQHVTCFEEIAHIHIDTFQRAYDVLARDKEKWAPKTRETADHSLPYIVLAACRYGEVSADIFTAERLKDEKNLSRLASMITVQVSGDLNRLYPEAMANRVVLSLRDGRTVQELVKYPLGHVGNPMNNQQIEEKFERLAKPVMRDAASALQALRGLESTTDFGELLSSMVVSPQEMAT